MKVTILGTSGGIPIPGRAQSGILIEESSCKILIDCGMGIPLRLAEANVDPEEIDSIFLTHEHLDHIQDLPSITKASWLSKDEAKYRIVHPPGLKDKLVRFWKSLDEFDRTDLDFQVLSPSETFQEGDLVIESFKTKHTEMSQGYKISRSNGSVVYTGDTAPVEDVMDKADGCDLLIHELSSLDKSENHTDPESLITALEDIDIGKLLVTHFYPETEERSEELVEKIEMKTGILTEAAEDLQTFWI